MILAPFAVAIVDSDATVPVVLKRTLARQLPDLPLEIDIVPTLESARKRLVDPIKRVDLWMIDGGRVAGVDVNGFCSELLTHRATFLRMTGDPSHVQQGLEGSTLAGEEIAEVMLKPFEVLAIIERVRSFHLAKTAAL